MVCIIQTQFKFVIYIFIFIIMFLCKILLYIFLLKLSIHDPNYLPKIKFRYSHDHLQADYLIVSVDEDKAWLYEINIVNTSPHQKLLTEKLKMVLSSQQLK